MKARVGIFGIGLGAHWAQFIGLKERRRVFKWLEVEHWQHQLETEI